MRQLSGNNKINAIGVMSGTSLDGLDIAAVEFSVADGKWTYELVDAKTIHYSSEWENSLTNAKKLVAEELVELDFKYGKYIGEEVVAFVQKSSFAPEIIASHGHTVFHQPEKGFTLQIGHGAAIAARTGINTICDFRSQDVALGGQGAPLVPVGDRLLFSDFDYCLNLGGFANISFDQGSSRTAFDICPVNIVLNEFAGKFGQPFDEGGKLGKQGKLIPELLNQLNTLPFYHTNGPKSLGSEWVDDVFLPLLNFQTASEYDIIRTVYEHIAIQIAKVVSNKGKMLVTGGGAFNTFLMELIQTRTTTKLIIPEKKLIEFKEAIVFAFLGVLRAYNINNCLASVTGAEHDHCSGVIYPFKKSVL